MSRAFEELDYNESPLGELILRRRRFPLLGDRDVFEVVLNDEFLMSSLFTEGEIALADLALAAVEGTALDVIVGGLGLGYTALTALANARVTAMTVVEALPAVIDWHRRGLLPDTRGLAGDPRCRLHCGDFFAAVHNGFRDLGGDRRYDAILLDIDHSPVHWLDPGHAWLYEAAGLSRVHACLREGGVFALWSNDPPSDAFATVLGDVFAHARAETVAVANPLTGNPGRNTIYIAQRAA